MLQAIDGVSYLQVLLRIGCSATIASCMFASGAYLQILHEL